VAFRAGFVDDKGQIMKTKLLLTTLASATLLMSGCAVVPVDDPYYDAPVVRVAPPPPQYEYMGPPPVIGYVWIGGYWNWVGTRHVWIPGRWEAPRPGYIWTPHRWERQGDHWRSYGGRWEPDHRPHVAPPPQQRYEQRYEQRSAPPQPHYEQRPAPQVVAPPPVMRQEPQPRYEQRPAPQVVAPPPVMRQEPQPRLEQESRRPPNVDPGRMPERRAEPPRVERDDRNGRGRDDRRSRDRDRDGDGRPDPR
jgi:hypothetical protein